MFKPKKPEPVAPAPSPWPSTVIVVVIVIAATVLVVNGRPVTGALSLVGGAALAAVDIARRLVPIWWNRS